MCVPSCANSAVSQSRQSRSARIDYRAPSGTAAPSETAGGRRAIAEVGVIGQQHFGAKARAVLGTGTSLPCALAMTTRRCATPGAGHC